MILYLHGFSSSGASSKAQQLRKLLAPEEILSPSYPSHAPHEAIAQLESTLEDCFPSGQARIMGSSLGGYYAQYLASRHGDARIVLINPSLRPRVTLQRCIGHNINMVSGEPFEFRHDQCEALAQYDVPAEAIAGRCLVLLDENDEVIDYRHALEKYQDLGQVHVFPGGSHRFEHLAESLGLIRCFFDSSRPVG